MAFLAEILQDDEKLQRMLPLIRVYEDFPQWCRKCEPFKTEIGMFKIIYDESMTLDAEQKELCLSLSYLRGRTSEITESRIAVFVEQLAKRIVETTDVEDAEKIISMNYQLWKRSIHYKNMGAISNLSWKNLFSMYGMTEKQDVSLQP